MLCGAFKILFNLRPSPEIPQHKALEQTTKNLRTSFDIEIISSIRRI